MNRQNLRLSIFILTAVLLLSAACGGSEVAEVQEPTSIEVTQTDGSVTGGPFLLQISEQVMAAIPQPTVSTSSQTDEVQEIRTTPVSIVASVVITNGVEGFNGKDHFVGSILDITFDPTQVKFFTPPVNKENYTITASEAVPIFQVYRIDDFYSDSDDYILTIRTEVELPPDAVLEIGTGEVATIEPDGTLIGGPVTVSLADAVPVLAETGNSSSQSESDILPATESDTITPAPVQGPPVDAQQYLLTALPVALQITTAADQLQKLLPNPQIGDPQWTTAVGAQAAVILLQHDKLTKIPPPAELQEAHTSLVGATGNCNEAALLLGNNLANLNQDIINSAQTSIKSCGGKIVETMAIIKNFVSQ